MINISKIDKAQGLGFLHFTPQDMTKEEAQAELDKTSSKYFDYLDGRIMKIDLSGNELDPRLYDRDNGQGAAEKTLKNKKLI